MAVGTKDLLNLSVLQPLTAAAPLSYQDAVERMSIIPQNRIQFPPHPLLHHSTERV